MRNFLVYCFGSDDFISVYADSFLVKVSPVTGKTYIWFEKPADCIACFPLSLVYRIELSDTNCNHKLVFENISRLDGCHYQLFD